MKVKICILGFLDPRCKMAEEGASLTLDSLLTSSLQESGAASPQDAVLVALHANLLSAGFVCVATGDEVNE